MASPRDVEGFRTSADRTIYRLPLQVFPGFWGNAYVVDDGDRPVLVDCGSGVATSNRDLERGMGQTPVDFADLAAVLITHGHIDHFGGLSFVRRKSDAPIGVHVLDQRVLRSYHERTVVASKRVQSFLETAGLDAAKQERVLAMYLSMKGLFTAVDVDFLLAEGPVWDGAFEALHVPGHCPGQVCLRVDDVLLTADHVLQRISPHVSPERITSWTGFGHYLEALDKVRGLDGIRLGLGGHQGPIEDVAARAGEIRTLVEERLAQVLEMCAEPRRIVELSRAVFGEVKSYNVLLALLETGAYVEYLHQRGELVATNLDEIEAERNPAVVYAQAP